MIMVPAENLYKQYLLGGGGGDSGGSFHGGFCASYTESLGVMSRINGYEDHGEACLGSDLATNPMAEDDSRTNSLNEAVSSSKDHIQEEKDDGWLRLGIGSHAAGSNNKHHEADPTAVRSGGLVELDLLSGDSTSQLAVTPPLGPVFHVPGFRSPPRPAMHSSTTASLFFHQNQQLGNSLMFPPHHQDISWPLIRPITQTMAAAAASSSSSSSSLIPFGWRPPFHPVQTGMDVTAAGPSSVDLRIIDPPRRPHSGIWFMLQASQNQAKEPFLPQIPKSYLRIKDGKMTVRLLMKYLVNKLRLDSESEVEITCRGQHLPPFLTLQHVRDNIWSTRDAVTLLPESSSPADHVMVLNYGRSAS